MKGSVKPRGKGTWRIRISLSHKPGEKRKYHTETYKGRKSEAEERLNALLAQFHNGGIPEVTKQTFDDYLKRWLKDALEGSVSDRTYGDYVNLIRRYITPKLGHLLLAKLQPFDVQGLYNEMRNRGLSPRTIRYTHNVISRSLRQAAIWGLVQRNVAQYTELPKQQTREMNAMTPEQVEAFLDAAQADKYYAMWYLALSTGLRPEEYFALRWTDIQGSNLIIQRAVCTYSKGGGYYYTNPKSKKGFRTIHLTAQTLEVLEIHRQEVAEHRELAGEAWQEEGLIFPNSIGKPLSLSNLTLRHFKPILEEAELPHFRVYDLRHTHASILLNKNLPLKVLQERLGHSSIQLTGDVYWHTEKDAQKQASEIFESEIFAGSKGRKKPTETKSGDHLVTKKQKAAR